MGDTDTIEIYAFPGEMFQRADAAIEEAHFILDFVLFFKKGSQSKHTLSEQDWQTLWKAGRLSKRQFVRMNDMSKKHLFSPLSPALLPILALEINSVSFKPVFLVSLFKLLLLCCNNLL